MDEWDRRFLKRCLDLIASFREKGWITEEEAADLRERAVESVAV